MAVGLLCLILKGEEEDVRLGMEQNPPGSTAGGLGAEEGIDQSQSIWQSVNQKSETGWHRNTLTSILEELLVKDGVFRRKAELPGLWEGEGDAVKLPAELPPPVPAGICSRWMMTFHCWLER